MKKSIMLFVALLLFSAIPLQAPETVYAAYSSPDALYTLPSMSVKRTMFAMNEVNGIIYAVGGVDITNGSYSLANAKKLEAYDPIANKWTLKADCPISKHDTASTVVGNNIYIIGGSDVTTSIAYSSVEVYNTITNKWSSAASMPVTLTNAGATTYDGKIYVSGGRYNPYTASPGKYNSDIIYIYDPATNVWTQKNIGAIGGTAVTYQNEIYLYMPKLFRKYNPQTGVITTLSPAPNVDAYNDMVVCRDKFYILGGQYTNTYVYEYDPAKDAWAKKIYYASENSTNAITAYNGKIYAAGGTTIARTTSYNTFQVYTPATTSTISLNAIPYQNAANLSWETTILANNYTVKRSTDGSTFQEIAKVTSQAYQDTTVEPQKEYIYMVTANYANGSEDSNAVTFVSSSQSDQNSKKNLLIRLKEKETCQLESYMDDPQTIAPSATWASADDSVATVEQDGKVMAVSAGITKMTVKASDDAWEDYLYVHVVPADKPTETPAPIETPQPTEEPQPTETPQPSEILYTNQKDANMNLASDAYRASESASEVWFGYASYAPSKALDGDLSTRWATDDNKHQPVTLSVAFKGVYRFNELYINEAFDRVNYYKIEYLSPNTTDTWVTLMEREGTNLLGTGSNKDVYLDGFGDIDASAIRITLDRPATEKGVTLKEFQVKYK